MKYGDSLRRRSIPEWQLYNVDYNEIKYLIKARTSKAQAKAIEIPGNSDHQPRDDFQDQLYVELVSQHDRINLFAKSKAGEIERRLIHLAKQIDRLAQKVLTTNGAPMTARRVEICSKYESEALKAGSELQSLARFYGANRIAFEKLLKKYQKWTGCPKLAARFHKRVRDQDSGFSKDTVESLMGLLTQVLASVRELYEQGKTVSSSTSKRDRPVLSNIPETKATLKGKPKTGPPNISVAAQLGVLDQTGLDVEFDTALATLPFENHGGNAVYWIHPDSLIELQVLLLQHSRLRPIRHGSQSSPGNASPHSRRSSLDKQLTHVTTAQREQLDEVGWMTCDNAERMVERHAASTIGAFETAAGSSVERSAVSVRWCSAGGALVTAADVPKGFSAPKIRRRVLRVKKKHLATLFDQKQDAPPNVRFAASDKDGEQPNEDESKLSCDDFRHLMKSNSGIQPLVQVECRRMRFSGLRNAPSQGLWISLDQNVTMKKADLDTFGRSGASTPTDEAEAPSTLKFPHALLSVRWEGSQNLELIDVLDKSHLTERARGFSIDIHAIAVLLKPKNISPLIWVPTLDRDIRKVPPDPKAQPPSSTPDSSTTKTSSPFDTSNTEAANSSSFAPAAESSATSAPETQASKPAPLPLPLSAFKKKRKLRRQYPSVEESSDPSASSLLLPDKGLQHRPDNPTRYWNEFDDGSEGGDSPDVYTIYVDPDAQFSFPGKKVLTYVVYDMPLAVLGGIKGLAPRKNRKGKGKQKQRAVSIEVEDQSVAESQVAERRPLLAEPNGTVPFNQSSSLAGYSSHRSASQRNPQSPRSKQARSPPQQQTYATFPRAQTDTDYEEQENAQDEALTLHLYQDRLLHRSAIISFILSFIFLIVAWILILVSPSAPATGASNLLNALDNLISAPDDSDEDGIDTTPLNLAALLCITASLTLAILALGLSLVRQDNSAVTGSTTGGDNFDARDDWGGYFDMDKDKERLSIHGDTDTETEAENRRRADRVRRTIGRRGWKYWVTVWVVFIICAGWALAGLILVAQ